MQVKTRARTSEYSTPLSAFPSLSLSSLPTISQDPSSILLIFFCNLQLFGLNLGSAAASKQPKRPTIIPEPSYNIPAVLLGSCALSHFAFGNDVLAGLSGILGVFLAVQASRVRFVFDDEALEVVVGQQKAKTENVFVGGANRWKYNTFVNWYVFCFS